MKSMNDLKIFVNYKLIYSEELIHEFLDLIVIWLLIFL